MTGDVDAPERPQDADADEGAAVASEPESAREYAAAGGSGD